MKAAYVYALLVLGSHTTEIAVIADSEKEARKKAIQLLGGDTKEVVDDLQTNLKLVRVTDLELLKQRIEQSLGRDRPGWMGEEN